jgi:hypothetical protein
VTAGLADWLILAAILGLSGFVIWVQTLPVPSAPPTAVIAKARLRDVLKRDRALTLEERLDAAMHAVRLEMARREVVHQQALAEAGRWVPKGNGHGRPLYRMDFNPYRMRAIYRWEWRR